MSIDLKGLRHDPDEVFAHHSRVLLVWISRVVRVNLD